MRLAKQAIDVCIQTDCREPMLSFWQRELGLRFDYMLPVGGGVQQHRHELNGSVLKLNHSCEPLTDEPLAGYRELLIAREDLSEPRHVRDPDGTPCSSLQRTPPRSEPRYAWARIPLCHHPGVGCRCGAP